MSHTSAYGFARLGIVTLIRTFGIAFGLIFGLGALMSIVSPGILYSDLDAVPSFPERLARALLSMLFCIILLFPQRLLRKGRIFQTAMVAYGALLFYTLLQFAVRDGGLSKHPLDWIIIGTVLLNAGTLWYGRYVLRREGIRLEAAA